MAGLVILVVMVWYAQATMDDAATRLTVMYPNTTQVENLQRVEAVPRTTRFGIEFGGIR